jgi:hypothetical protein
MILLTTQCPKVKKMQRQVTLEALWSRQKNANSEKPHREFQVPISHGVEKNPGKLHFG